MSISFDNGEKNKKETLARITEVVKKCFEEVEHKASFELTGDHNFFASLNNSCYDYLLLLSKIKNSFSFAINDAYIAGETTVDGFCSGILKAQNDIEQEKAMGRFNPEGLIIISDQPKVYVRRFKRTRFVKITSEFNDFHFIAEAKKLLDKDKMVVMMPRTTEELACVVYLALQSNIPIVFYKSNIPASKPIDARSYYDSSFNEKLNLKNIAERIKIYL